MTIKHFDRYLSVAAIIIAAAAFVVSCWQFKDTQEHNRLSVRPHLRVTPQLEGPGGRTGLYLSNVGLGPAIVKNLKITVAGKSYEGLGKDLWPVILRDVRIEPFCFARGWPNPEDALKAGDETVLLGITRADLGACYMHMLKLIGGHEIIVEIDYESMYREPFAFKGNVQVDDEDAQLSAIGKMLAKPYTR